MPGTCQCYLIWKGVFAYVIKLRILRRGVILDWLSLWSVNAITSVLSREWQREIRHTEGVEAMGPRWKWLEECGYESRNAWSYQKLEDANSEFSSRASKGVRSC